MDALGALNAAPHIGISMVKAGWDAVTVSAAVPEDMFSVGVRPPRYSNGAAACMPVPGGQLISGTAGGRQLFE